MAVVLRVYDVEPTGTHPTVPTWAGDELGFPAEEAPQIGDELQLSQWSLTNDDGVKRAIPERGETHYWRVIRRTQDLHPRGQRVILGVRFVS